MATKTPPAKQRARYTRTFTVNRAKWLHGGVRVVEKGATEGVYPGGELLHVSGLQCCLGFVARQCGIPLRAMRDVGMASDLTFRNDADARRQLQKVRGVLVKAQSEDPYSSGDLAWASTAAGINDATHLTPTAREARLRSAFAAQGYRLVFTGAYRTRPLVLK